MPGGAAGDDAGDAGRPDEHPDAGDEAHAAGAVVRTVAVPPERLDRWFGTFAERHGGIRVTHRAPDHVRLTAPDGAVATCAVPFPPLDPGGDALAALVAHAGRERRVGVLLVRRGGHAAGVFAGTRLRASKVGSRYVQGRTKAGGWSQQRFARRRRNQAGEAFAAAADAAAAVLVPAAGELAAVVCGGDRAAVDAVLADARLAPLRPLVRPGLLAVPDPRLRVLERTPDRFRAVSIGLNAAATD